MKPVLHLLLLFMAVLIIFGKSSFAQTQALWSETSELSIVTMEVPFPFQAKRTAYSLSFNEMKDVLQSAPMERTLAARTAPLSLSVPTPDGGFQSFAIVEVQIMEPGLAVQFPEIRTYAGQGIDDPTASIRFDLTSAGFHAMVFSSDGDYFIDPYSRGDLQHYVLHAKRDADPAHRSWSCTLEADPKIAEEIKNLVATGVMTPTGATLRTYRLACAATGEYTAFFGGTVALGQAAIVTAMNRVNGVYEKELAVRMILVANNSSVVYTNSTTDPFSNSNGSTMLGQNQTNMTTVIGSANYDIGHVFSTGGGGVAGLGVVCVSGQKARGVTGSGSPTGDGFWIDYVAHEMGHQFGGNHTFNSTASNCGGGNRNGSTAYEPGSGSTIQAYAGICGADDLQPNSDAFFHTISFDEMVAFTNSGAGNGCAAQSSTGNGAPTINAGTGGFTIPKSTPFTLTGSATDPNGHALTYCWEEFDLGPSGSPGSPSGNAPIFRSFNPVASASRTFPKQSDLLNNTSTIGEILPTYARTLTFRLTARDNQTGGGGVDRSQISFSVSGTAGPFLVTVPNTVVSWGGNSTQTVTWNVAGTDASPISCSNVNILLSTNGGVTFPTTLVSNTPNDGSQAVTVPNISTTTARVKVEAVGNIFFDLSNTNFTITLSTLSTPALVFPSNNAIEQPVSLTLLWNTVATATAYKLQVSTDSTFAGGFIANDSTITDTSYALNSLSVNTKYIWRVRAANSGSTSSYSTLRRFTTIAPPATVSLVSPLQSAAMQPQSLNLVWNAASGALAYALQVSTDSTFTTVDVLNDSTLTDTLYLLNGLSLDTKYFWRARASNTVGNGGWSGVRTFATVAVPAATMLVSPADDATGVFSPTMEWNAVFGAATYVLQVSTDSAFTGGMAVDDSTIADTSFVVTGLSNATEYFWRVRASNIAGTGSWSMSRSFTTLALPSVVTLASPSDSTLDQPVSGLTVRWDAEPVSASYRLQLSIDSTFTGGFVVNDSSLTDTFRLAGTLVSGTEYFWRVMGENPAGTGGWSDVWRFTTATAPLAVTLVLPATDFESPVDSLVVEWNSTPSASVYWLELSLDSLFSASAVDSTMTDTTTILHALQDSAVYYWRVRAANLGGWGPFSEVRQYSTLFKVEVCITLIPGWNLVSIPVHADNDSSQVLFPSCGVFSCGFEYIPGSGYQMRCEFEPGKGYWLHCSSGACITGVSIPRDTVSVQAGWNVIGSVTNPVNVGNITTNPPGIISSEFYAFDNGYKPVSSILPGGAYWVKMNQAGTIILDGSASPVTAPARTPIR